MRFSTLALAAVALVSEVDAGYIAPYPFWRSISWTLPGSTYKKRDVAQLDDSVLETRGSKYNDLYSACGTKNMASKFNKYPINGYGYTSASIRFGRFSSGDQPLLRSESATVPSAYDCCVKAMQNKNSTLFFYTSNPGSFPDFETGAPIANPNCRIVYNTVNPIPNLEVLLMSASYNGSAPRGTTYGNYIGNGNIGPGVRVAVNNAITGTCSGASGGAGVNNGQGGSAESGASAAACAFTTPQTPDVGGANPVGSGAAAGASAAAQGE